MPLWNHGFFGRPRPLGDQPASAFDPSRMSDPLGPWPREADLESGGLESGVAWGTGDPQRNPIGFAPPENTAASRADGSSAPDERHHDWPQASALPDEAPSSGTEDSWALGESIGSEDENTDVSERVPFYKREIGFRRKRSDSSEGPAFEEITADADPTLSDTVEVELEVEPVVAEAVEVEQDELEAEPVQAWWRAPEAGDLVAGFEVEDAEPVVRVSLWQRLGFGRSSDVSDDEEFVSELVEESVEEPVVAEVELEVEPVVAEAVEVEQDELEAEPVQAWWRAPEADDLVAGFEVEDSEPVVRVSLWQRLGFGRSSDVSDDEEFVSELEESVEEPVVAEVELEDEPVVAEAEFEPVVAEVELEDEPVQAWWRAPEADDLVAGFEVEDSEPVVRVSLWQRLGFGRSSDVSDDEEFVSELVEESVEEPVVAEVELEDEPVVAEAEFEPVVAEVELEDETVQAWWRAPEADDLVAGFEVEDSEPVVRVSLWQRLGFGRSSDVSDDEEFVSELEESVEEPVVAEVELEDEPVVAEVELDDEPVQAWWRAPEADDLVAGFEVEDSEPVVRVSLWQRLVGGGAKSDSEHPDVDDELVEEFEPVAAEIELEDEPVVAEAVAVEPVEDEPVQAWWRAPEADDLVAGFEVEDSEPVVRVSLWQRLVGGGAKSDSEQLDVDDELVEEFEPVAAEVELEDEPVVAEAVAVEPVEDEPVQAWWRAPEADDLVAGFEVEDSEPVVRVSLWQRLVGGGAKSDSEQLDVDDELVEEFEPVAAEVELEEEPVVELPQAASELTEDEAWLSSEDEQVDDTEQLEPAVRVSLWQRLVGGGAKSDSEQLDVDDELVEEFEPVGAEVELEEEPVVELPQAASELTEDEAWLSSEDEQVDDTEQPETPERVPFYKRQLSLRRKRTVSEEEVVAASTDESAEQFELDLPIENDAEIVASDEDSEVEPVVPSTRTWWPRHESPALDASNDEPAEADPATSEIEDDAPLAADSEQTDAADQPETSERVPFYKRQLSLRRKRATAEDESAAIEAEELSEIEFGADVIAETVEDEHAFEIEIEVAAELEPEFAPEADEVAEPVELTPVHEIEVVADADLNSEPNLWELPESEASAPSLAEPELVFTPVTDDAPEHVAEAPEVWDLPTGDDHTTIEADAAADDDTEVADAADAKDVADLPAAPERVAFYKRELSLRRKPRATEEPDAVKGDAHVPGDEISTEGYVAAEAETTAVAEAETTAVAEDTTPETSAGEDSAEPEAVTSEAPPVESSSEDAPTGGGRLAALKRKAPRTKTSRRGQSQGGKGRKVVGLKIGASQIAAAVVVDGADGNELVSLARRPLATGIVVDGEIRNEHALATAIKELFDEEKLPRTDVRIGLSSNRIGVRTLEIAGIDDEARFDNAVRFKAHEVLPVALDESVLDYRVLGERKAEDGSQVRRVLLVVAPRDQVEPYLRVAAEAGIGLAGIDLEALGLLRAFVEPKAAPVADAVETASVVVAIGHESSTLLVSGGGVSEFTRVFDWGGAALQDAIASSLDVLPAEATTILRHLSLSGPGRQYDPIDEIARQTATDAIRQRLTPFARELVNSLQFYQTQPESLGIGGIVITGGTSHLEGLDEALHQMIGVGVSVGDPFSRVRRSDALDPALEASSGSLAVSIGLAIEDDSTRGINLLPKEAVARRSRTQSVKAVGGPVAVALPIAAMAILYFGAHGSVSDRQTELSAIDAEIATLPAPQRPTIDPALAGEEAARATAVASLLGGRVAWDAVFRDMSRVLPANVWLTNLSLTQPAAGVVADGTTPTTVAPVPGEAPAAPSAVSIEGYTYSQPDVALLLARLATLPTLQRVTLTSSDIQVVGSKKVFHFLIVADLNQTGGAS